MAQSKILVKMEAEIGRLTKDLDRASRKISRFERDAKKSVGGVKASFSSLNTSAKGLIAGLGAFVGIRAFKNLIRDTSDAIDQTAKFADVIGLATEEIAGYQLATELTGGTINQMQTGFTRLQKNIADAESGLKTAVREFDRLGISVTQLRSLSTDEQIKLIADRFQELPSTIDRASVALNLFGRGGVQLQKLLNEGAAGIRRYQEEARQLGLAFSRLDAAKVEEANDALTRGQAIVTGFNRKLSIELSPVITAITNQFIEAGKEAGGFGNIARDGIDKVTSVVGVFADGLHGIKVLWKVLTAGAGQFAKYTVGAMAKAGDAISRTVSESLAGIEKYVTIASKVPGPLGTPFKVLAKQLRDIQTTGESSLKRLSDDIDTFAAESAAGLQAALMEEIPSTGIERALERARAASESAAAEIAANIDKSLAPSGGISPVAVIDQPESPVAALVTGLEEAEVQAEETSTAMSAFADEAARNMQSAFADFLFDPFSEGLDGLLDNFLRTLQRMIAEAAAAQIFESLGGIGGGGGGGGGNWASAIGAFFAGARANGGPVAAGNAYMVGERGPELFMPGVNGNILANAAGGGGVSTGDVNMVFPGVVNADQAQRAGAAASRALVRQLGGARRYS